MVNSIYSNTLLLLLMVASSVFLIKQHPENMLAFDLPTPAPVEKILKTLPKTTVQTIAAKSDPAVSKSQKIKTALNVKVDQEKIAYVLKKSAQMGLPATVALVPVVESKYKTNAVSNKGAAGAWQLMPATAKSYGLQPKERFNFKAATNAALTMLKDLHAQFKSWSLAFAAYNAGPNRVLKALASHPHAKSIDQLGLPSETKNYVKKIMHLAKITDMSNGSIAL